MFNKIKINLWKSDKDNNQNHPKKREKCSSDIKILNLNYNRAINNPAVAQYATIKNQIANSIFKDHGF